MSTGSMRSCPPSGGSVTSVTFAIPTYTWKRASIPRASRSDVQEPDVLGVAGDERAAGLDVLAHQHTEQLVRLGGVVQGHLQEQAVRRVHRGLPQLVGVHLAETLVALDAVVLVDLLAGLQARGHQAVALAVGVG